MTLKKFLVPFNLINQLTEHGIVRIHGKIILLFRNKKL